jgi:hypothetical protein
MMEAAQSDTTREVVLERDENHCENRGHFRRNEPLQQFVDYSCHVVSAQITSSCVCGIRKSIATASEWTFVFLDLVEERARTHVHGSAAEHASDSAGLHTYNTGESIHATRHVNMVLLVALSCHCFLEKHTEIFFIKILVPCFILQPNNFTRCRCKVECGHQAKAAIHWCDYPLTCPRHPPEMIQEPKANRGIEKKTTQAGRACAACGAFQD